MGTRAWRRVLARLPATHDETGSVSAEYVMIAAGIAGVLLVIVTALGGRIEALYAIP